MWGRWVFGRAALSHTRKLSNRQERLKNRSVQQGVTMRTRRQPVAPSGSRPRPGAATLDYILVLGIILPLVAFIVPAGKRIMALVYEMICVFVAWPFL